VILTTLPIGALEGFRAFAHRRHDDGRRHRRGDGLPPDDVANILTKLADLAAIEAARLRAEDCGLDAAAARTVERSTTQRGCPRASVPSAPPPGHDIDVSAIGE